MTSLRRGLVALGAMAVLGCDVPTDVPMVEQRWIIPLNDAGISVDRFLPAGVIVEGEVFAIAVEPFTGEGVLGDVCASCTSGGAVPPFQGTFSASGPLPGDVTGAVLETGSVVVAIQNGWSFDPTAGGGSVVINITDGPGGRVLGQTTITSGMIPGGTVTRGVILSGGSISPNLMATAIVTSAGGQAGTVDTEATLLMSVNVVALQAGFVTVVVADRVVGTEPIVLDLEGIDQTVTDQVEGGSLIFDITNPFNVPMTLDMVITFPGGALTRTVEVERSSVSTVTIPYEGEELRSFMSKANVTLTAEGPVSGEAAPILLRTDEGMTFDASLDLTLVIG